MKYFLIIAAILFASALHGQQPPKRDAKVNSYYSRVINGIKPGYRKFVTNATSQFTNRSLDADSLARALRQNPQLSSLTSTDIETLTLLIMVETSGKIEAELNTLLDEMKAKNSSKKSMRSATNKDSSTARAGRSGDKDDMQDLSEEKMFRIRQLTDAREKLEQMISNIMKKLDETENTISNNLKG